MTRGFGLTAAIYWPKASTSVPVQSPANLPGANLYPYNENVSKSSFQYSCNAHDCQSKPRQFPWP